VPFPLSGDQTDWAEESEVNSRREMIADLSLRMGLYLGTFQVSRFEFRVLLDPWFTVKPET
jgi:hypothetical protein